MDYLDLTIKISPDSDEGVYRVLVSTKAKTDTTSTPLRLSGLGSDSRLRRVLDAAVGLSRAGFGEAGVETDGTSEDDLKRAGAALFEALFKDSPAGEALIGETRAAMVGQVKTGVRIRLSMNLAEPRMTDVARLPWELMWKTGDQFPLPLADRAFVRKLDGVPKHLAPINESQKLRMLVVMSNPTDTAHLNLEKERTRLRKEWDGISKNMTVDFVSPRRADIADLLRKHDYHIFHFMGHGDFDPEEGGRLLLEKADGTSDPLTGGKLASMLSREPMRLVFLNACKTATSGQPHAADPFAGVADALVRSGVPAVVAMRSPISDEAAIAFAAVFYGSIADGFPVDAAITEARHALYDHENPALVQEWSTPVLYLQPDDGVLFPRASDVEPAQKVAASATVPTTATGKAVDEDPWGRDADNVFRLFLGAFDSNLKRKVEKLSADLAALPGVRVVHTVAARDDAHRAAVKRLAQRAHLCVHVLGSAPGEALDDPDGNENNDPLRDPEDPQTYPLVDVHDVRTTGRPQLVLMSRKSRADAGIPYQACIDSLEESRTDAQELDLACDMNNLLELVKNKIDALRPAVRDRAVGTAGTALVDSHVDHAQEALELLKVLKDRQQITAKVSMSQGTPSDAFLQFDVNLASVPLYILVAGKVDDEWVENRVSAAMRAAVKATSGARTVILRYFPQKLQAGVEAEFEVVVGLNRDKPQSVEAAFKESRA